MGDPTLWQRADELRAENAHLQAELEEARGLLRECEAKLRDVRSYDGVPNNFASNLTKRLAKRQGGGDE